MPLNIHVEAEPDSMFAFADWLNDTAGRIGFWADAGPRQARQDSEDGWTGPAAEGFRAVAYRLSSDGGTLDDGYRATAQTLTGHARDIITVKDKMNEARDMAAGAGLACTGEEIADPGQPPPKPQPVQTGGTPEELNDRADAWEAWRSWNDKAEVYAKCATLVTEARRIEQDSQNRAVDIVRDMANTGDLITTTDFLNGLAAGYITRQSAWRTTAQTLTGLAEQARLAGADPAHGAPTQAKNLLLSLVTQAKVTVAEAKANTNHIGRWLERLPPVVRRSITRELGQYIPKNARYLASAPEVLKKISVVGGGLSVGSVVTQISAGKDPATSIISNGLGLLAGTGTGMVFGGPFGAIAAFIVGTGTTMTVENTMTPDPKDVTVIAPATPDRRDISGFDR